MDDPVFDIFRRTSERLDESIHVLLTDVVMPNVRGPELAKRVWISGLE